MTPMKIMLLIAMLLLCLAPQANADTPPRITTQAELDHVIAQLNKPETKMAALKELTRFASLKVYQIGSIYMMDSDPKKNALEDEAAAAVRSQENFPTITQSLNSSDPELQYWGVFHFPLLGPYTGTDKKWLAFLPKIEQLANASDFMTRRMVYDKLAYDPSEEYLLTERLLLETEPINIVNLIRYTDAAQGEAAIQALFLKYFAPLLQNKDRDVRLGALYFIGENDWPHQAYPAKFNDAVVQGVIVLTHSADVEEQNAALFALAELKRQNAATGTTNSKPVK